MATGRSKTVGISAILKPTSGSVTPFGLLNDEQCRFEFVLGNAFKGEIIGCHHNDNTLTVWLQSDDLIEIIKNRGNSVCLPKL